jgi:hypothetical protein
MRVLDTFVLPGRGLIVSTDKVANVTFVDRRIATITLPDGSKLEAEVLGSRLQHPDYLLAGIGKDDVPIGSIIEIG